MVNSPSLQLTSLPTEILFLIVFSIDNPKDLRSFASTNHLFRALAGPHTVTAQLWFEKKCRDIPPEDLLRTANNWGFPLKTEYAKQLITVNAPVEPSGLSAEPSGPRRALQRIDRVLHIVERFGLFLHNMLAVNYYYAHDWEVLQQIADELEQYLEDLGWVQYYRGQMYLGIDSMMVSIVCADQEFEAVAFEKFAEKLRHEIFTTSNITPNISTTSDMKTTVGKNHTRRDSAVGGLAKSNNGNITNNHGYFASLAPEPLYLKWTSLVQDQLDFFSLEQYIIDKFKPPSKWQLAEYLKAVVKYGVF